MTQSRQGQIKGASDRCARTFRVLCRTRAQPSPKCLWVSSLRGVFAVALESTIRAPSAFFWAASFSLAQGVHNPFFGNIFATWRWKSRNSKLNEPWSEPLVGTSEHPSSIRARFDAMSRRQWSWGGQTSSRTGFRGTASVAGILSQRSSGCQPSGLVRRSEAVEWAAIVSKIARRVAAPRLLMPPSDDLAESSLRLDGRQPWGFSLVSICRI